MRLFRPFVFGLVIFTLAVSACSPSQSQPTPSATLASVTSQAIKTEQVPPVPTVTVTPLPSATAAPSSTPTSAPSPTALRTPPDLPGQFQSALLNPADIPTAYVSDRCQEIHDRWKEGNAAPGTVVMPIMFHRITDGDITQPYQVTAESVQQLLSDLHQQDFHTITMEQLAGFLQHNAWIPQRSVMLIADDLHTEEYYRDHFVPVFREYGWTMVNAWISDETASKQVIPGNQLLAEEGWVEYQAHGYIHNINISEALNQFAFVDTVQYGDVLPNEFIRRELEGSMQTITAVFGKPPIAYIWPGGNWSAKGIEVARETGFQLGFTVNPRGPLMYNWIPQGHGPDPNRPSFQPEGDYQDPLMLLPRYWDVDASSHIDTVRQISNAAEAYANENKDNELLYYDIMCREKLGDLQ